MIYNFKKALGTVLSLALIVLFMASCQKEDNGDNGQGNDVTSITLSSSEGNDLTVNTSNSFVVKNNKGEEVTSDSEIYVGESQISGNSFTFDKVGSFEVYAKYQNLTSNRLTITVSESTTNNSLTEFTAKVITHDFTGTWCGYCAAALLELYEKAEQFPNKLIPIEIHGGGSGNAPEGKELFDFPNGDAFGVQGYPTVWYNFDSNFEYFGNDDISSYVSNKIKTGLAINYDLDGGNVKVTMRSDKEINGTKIAVYLLEGKLISNQTNYDNDNPSSPSYQKGDVIENFEYNNVARASLTESPLGDAISGASGSEHTMVYSLEGKTDNVKDLNNTKVVAFVLDSSGKYVNAQVATANENKDFD